MVVNIEVLQDFRGFKLEGMQSATFEDVMGELVKYYNKPGLRREAKTPTNVALMTLRSLIEEGIDSALIHRRMAQISMKVNGLTRAVKGGNRVVVETKRIYQAILDKFIRNGEVGGRGLN